MQIKNADGSIRDNNWPAEPSVMLNDIRDQKNEADKAALQAFKATHGQLKSYSYRGTPSMGKIQRVNNTTGQVEWVDV